MFVLFCSSLVCISAYANAYFKITIYKQNIKVIMIVGVPSSQALPGFLITAPPSVCVSTVPGLVSLAVWIQNPKKNNHSSISPSLGRRGFPAEGRIWPDDFSKKIFPGGPY